MVRDYLAADILFCHGSLLPVGRDSCPRRAHPLLRRAKTDSQRTIIYDPEHRPEVASLLLTAALCTGRDPHHIADELGGRGAAALKALVTEAVNEHLRALRQRRRELAGDPAIVRQALDEGNAAPTTSLTTRSSGSGRR